MRGMSPLSSSTNKNIMLRAQVTARSREHTTLVNSLSLVLLKHPTAAQPWLSTYLNNLAVGRELGRGSGGPAQRSNWAHIILLCAKST